MFKAAARQHSERNRVIHSLDDFLRQMVNSWERARNALQIAQHSQKKYYDKRHEGFEFSVGEKVYLSTKREKYCKLIQFASNTGSRKFQPTFLGPFKII